MPARTTHCPPHDAHVLAGAYVRRDALEGRGQVGPVLKVRVGDRERSGTRPRIVQQGAAEHVWFLVSLLNLKIFR
jgi:hypothetical protein